MVNIRLLVVSIIIFRLSTSTDADLTLSSDDKHTNDDDKTNQKVLAAADTVVDDILTNDDGGVAENDNGQEGNVDKRAPKSVIMKTIGWGKRSSILKSVRWGKRSPILKSIRWGKRDETSNENIFKESSEESSNEGKLLKIMLQLLLLACIISA